MNESNAKQHVKEVTPRWHRFSLRSLMIALLFLGPISAWVYDHYFSDIYAGVVFEEFEAVGGINSDDADHVVQLLHDNRIPNIVEGSRIYGIPVPPKHVERAIRIVETDSKRRNYWFEPVSQ
ncbi:MAG: hypothetical protein AAF456_18370 [Planctomycetota bacterium]